MLFIYFVFLQKKGVTFFFFFFQAEDGIRDKLVTGVQTCALPIFARVLVAEDQRVRLRHHLHVAACVIAVMMRADDVLERLVGDALDERHDLVVVLLEHVVDQDHAVVGHAHRERVGAGIEDGVEPRLHRLDRELRRRRASALPRLPDESRDRPREHNRRERRFSSQHGPICSQGCSIFARMTVARYGTWISPLSARVIAAGALRLSGITLDTGEIYWIEGRPSEGGRNVLVRRDANLHTSDLAPPGVNVRTRVHEYGGPAYIVSNGDAFYVNFADQRVYKLAEFTHPEPSNTPVPITPEGFFYGDFTIDRKRRRLICVREDHTQKDG